MNPSSGYPALVAGGQITIQNITQSATIGGLVYSEGDSLIKNVENCVMTGILYSELKITIRDSDSGDFMIDGSMIAHDNIVFFNSYNSDVDWGNTVLTEPPGFTWTRFAMGYWEETY